VTSDHGFSTHTGGVALDALLQPHHSTLPSGDPAVVAGGGAIYVRHHDQAAIAAIVAALQRSPEVGAVFTAARRTGRYDGRIAGTLSFDAIRWTHARSADNLFAPNWTDEKNEFGVAGTTASGGVAGHGGSSPYDVHNTLIAAGPDLKTGRAIEAPSANVDFAPTILRSLGVPIPATMQGRVLQEAFADSGNELPRVRPAHHTARTRDGSYAVTAWFSVVKVGRQEHRYLDFTKVVRKLP
jgi:arylsulfatase A-like enzyme